ncbi:MAG: amino acid-binding domain protein [Oscillospiraceae bacterium]|nr:amino acid-binding domain protein [Oscillospiraceae bacterium]
MPDEKQQLILIEKNVVPETFLKVLEAKQLLKKGKAKNSTEACKLAQISRSAFYKYKDSVHYYEDKSAKKIITLYLTLSDEPGVLSSVLTALYELGSNIITVNQNIPAEDVAIVTISVRLNQKRISSDGIVSFLSKLHGVIDIKII